MTSKLRIYEFPISLSVGKTKPDLTEILFHLRIWSQVLGGIL